MEGRLSLVAGGQVPVTICHQEKERITRFAVFRWRHLGLPCSTPGCSFSVPRSFLMVLALYVARADNPKSTLCVVVQVRLHGSLHELSPSVLAAQVSPWLKKSRMVCTKPCIPAIGEVVHATSNQGALLALNPLVCPDTLWAAPVSRSCCGFTDCVEGSPLPSTQCARGAFFALVTRLSATFRETARPGGGRVCRLRCVACVLLRGVPHVGLLPCLARLGARGGLISFCPSTALWRTVAWQDCQSRAAAMPAGTCAGRMPHRWSKQHRRQVVRDPVERGPITSPGATCLCCVGVNFSRCYELRKK